MTNHTISRRKFLQVTISSAAMSTGSASLCAAEKLFTTSPGKNHCESLCLFETEFFSDAKMSGKLQNLGLHKQTISLNDASDWLDITKALATTQNQALLIMGRPATVFTMKNILGADWRVILEGQHYRNEHGMAHEFSGLKPPIGHLNAFKENIINPDQYIKTLVSAAQYGLKIEAEINRMKFQTPTWSEVDLASILAWPKGGII